MSHEPIQLKVKRLHPAARLPTRAHATDAGLDFYAHRFYPAETGVTTVEPHRPLAVGTGVAVEIQPGWCLVLKTRSGMARDGWAVEGGVIDHGFTGEVVVLLRFPDAACSLSPGDKIAQGLMVPVPACEVIEVDELTPTPRGANGFGSTGA